VNFSQLWRNKDYFVAIVIALLLILLGLALLLKPYPVHM
jgi:hypothetical protein